MNDADEPRFCAECVHAVYSVADMNNPDCGHPLTASPVTGRVGTKSCEWARSFDGPCMPHGWLFERGPNASFESATRRIRKFISIAPTGARPMQALERAGKMVRAAKVLAKAGRE